ncbi:unnamed protein product [Durusdinium trenchii]|uniref:Uncharacterized protein n=2 Tax=Durusdinium trenchii TaxID=1381693 RepID=A0ABP0ND04_9DINO
MSGLDSLLALRVIQQSFSSSPAFVQAPLSHAPADHVTLHRARVGAAKPPQKAASQPSGAANGMLLGASAASAMLGCRVLRKVIGRRSRQAKVLRRQGPLLKERTEAVATEEDAAQLAERLQLEAAKLRADIEELEAISAAEERRKRLALFRSWDLDSSGTLDEKALDRLDCTRNARLSLTTPKPIGFWRHWIRTETVSCRPRSTTL